MVEDSSSYEPVNKPHFIKLFIHAYNTIFFLTPTPFSSFFLLNASIKNTRILNSKYCATKARKLPKLYISSTSSPAENKKIAKFSRCSLRCTSGSTQGVLYFSRSEKLACHTARPMAPHNRRLYPKLPINLTILV